MTSRISEDCDHQEEVIYQERDSESGGNSSNEEENDETEEEEELRLLPNENNLDIDVNLSNEEIKAQVKT